MELTWTEVKGKKRTYELQGGDQTLATVAYPSMWKSDVVVTYGNDSFVFRTEGFWQNRILVRAAEAEDVIATVKRKFTATTIEFANGRVFTLKTRGFFQQLWELVAPDNAVVISVKAGKGFWRPTTLVMVPESAAAYPEIRVLLPLVFHLRLMAQQQAATAAAAT